MIDQLRDLLDRPLDRRHAQAIVALASCLTIGFAALFALGVLDRPAGTAAPRGRHPRLSPTAPKSARAGTYPLPRPSDRRRASGQDPQDRRGTSAYRRARRTARDHRALQHLPYRIDRVTFALVGADEGRAVIRIAGPSIAAAHRAWSRFLDRFADDGRAYETRFEAGARNGITGRPKVAGEGARGAARADGTDRRARRRVPHQDRHRAAHRNLTSKPHPKESP